MPEFIKDQEIDDFTEDLSDSKIPFELELPLSAPAGVRVATNIEPVYIDLITTDTISAGGLVGFDPVTGRAFLADFSVHGLLSGPSYNYDNKFIVGLSLRPVIGGTVTTCISGVMPGFIGLVAGETYYTTNGDDTLTASEATNLLGIGIDELLTNSYVKGQAISATEMIFK